ncbi:MAG: hypothetical protein ISR65_03455 [Bacteriovoracaceae bacterium]|nr:hypothetical protein [Bacteriovoracaceae bacterium]
MSDDQLVVKATRKDLQISRRIFHMVNGSVIATAYNLTLTHKQVVYMLGTGACLLYLFDQIRISYPELSNNFARFTKYILRAEEQLKESAAVPYIIAILLTILSFPKVIALCSIYTLAFADPLSAIIGIRFGKRHIVKEKSVEGSIAFFLTTFLCVLLVFDSYHINGWKSWVVAGLVSFMGAGIEMLPLRLDDNLTIPLFTAFTLWIFCSTFGVHVV